MVILSSEDEIREEALEVCRMRGIVPRADRGHEYLLTPSQYTRLQTFLGMVVKAESPMTPNIIFNLADNPEWTLGWTLDHLSIPPYRRNSSGFWVAAYSRYMTTRERLASLGWPVYPSLAAAGRQPFVEFDWQLARDALGNGICLPNVGVALLCALSCCRRIE